MRGKMKISIIMATVSLIFYIMKSKENEIQKPVIIEQPKKIIPKIIEKPVPIQYKKRNVEDLPVVMDVVATAYCPCEYCTDGDGKTSTNRNAWLPGVAVDPKVIPLGSRIDIPYYGGQILADDIGGRIKGKRIDVRFKTHTEAKIWGVKKIGIVIWKKSKE
jgi:3D (Asp-Asp-Asp) domain-containing protein